MCPEMGLTPVPLTKSILSSFVAHLAANSLKFRMIKVYLSAETQIESGHHDPFLAHIPKLEYVLKGVKREETE